MLLQLLLLLLLRLLLPLPLPLVLLAVAVVVVLQVQPLLLLPLLLPQQRLPRGHGILGRARMAVEAYVRLAQRAEPALVARGPGGVAHVADPPVPVVLFGVEAALHHVALLLLLLLLVLLRWRRRLWLLLLLPPLALRLLLLLLLLWLLLLLRRRLLLLLVPAVGATTTTTTSATVIGDGVGAPRRVARRRLALGRNAQLLQPRGPRHLRGGARLGGAPATSQQQRLSLRHPRTGLCDAPGVQGGLQLVQQVVRRFQGERRRRQCGRRQRRPRRRQG